MFKDILISIQAVKNEDSTRPVLTQSAARAEFQNRGKGPFWIIKVHYLFISTLLASLVLCSVCYPYSSDDIDSPGLIEHIFSKPDSNIKIDSTNKIKSKVFDVFSYHHIEASHFTLASTPFSDIGRFGSFQYGINYGSPAFLIQEWEIPDYTKDILLEEYQYALSFWRFTANIGKRTGYDI